MAEVFRASERSNRRTAPAPTIADGSRRRRTGGRVGPCGIEGSIQNSKSHSSPSSKMGKVVSVELCIVPSPFRPTVLVYEGTSSIRQVRLEGFSFTLSRSRRIVARALDRGARTDRGQKVGQGHFPPRFSSRIPSTRLLHVSAVCSFLLRTRERRNRRRRARFATRQKRLDASLRPSSCELRVVNSPLLRGSSPSLVD